MGKHSSRYKNSPLAVMQPRNRREVLFLVGVLLIATFFVVRVSQFRSLTPRANTITAVLSTTQVVHRNHGTDGDDEPTAVFTEVFIDSGSGEGFRRPRKQSEAQVKYDSQRKSLLDKSKADTLPVNSKVSDNSKTGVVSRNNKLSTEGNKSDTTSDSVQRRAEAETRKFTNELAMAAVPKNVSKSEPGSGSIDLKPTWEQASKRTDARAAKQDHGGQAVDTDKLLPAQVVKQQNKSLSSQGVQKASSMQKQAEEAASSKLILPSLLDPTEVVLPNQMKGQPQGQQKTTSQASPPPAPVIRQRITGVPNDFDWQTYLLYNPELRDKGIGTQQQAEDHYVRVGYTEGMIYKRLRVLLRYTACTGLINQHYSHIAAFSLCAVLGAELVLPPAVKRDSFAHYFSVFKEHNEVKWTPAPLESLLNVDKIVEFWRGRGLTVHRTPSLLPFPDLTQPELAYPMYPQPEIDPRLIARIDDVYLRNLDMPELIEKARIAVIGHAAKLLKQDPGRTIDYIVLDMPCTFFMLRSLSNLRVVTEVARSLEFSDKVTELADRVIHGMTMAGKYEYNAVHLRIEKDARDWSQIMGGEEVVWNGYVTSMLQAGFTSDLVLYAASGLLTYGANDEMDHLIGTLKDAGLCKDVHYKELYIPQAELEELNSEQKALVDFMVLSRGRGFVGFGSSTFSFYLREYRVLSGIPRSSSVLVDASVIGTDPLFNSAGTVI
ncbi:hypothetical protein ABBQ32_009214 [Trebouxia sp. C0010 RCD-2024]